MKDVRSYVSTDIRFTTKGETLYAFCMNSPEGNIEIASLGKQGQLNSKTIASVKMLGSKEKLKWKQQDNALVINKPANLPAWKVVAFAIEFKK